MLCFCHKIKKNDDDVNLQVPCAQMTLCYNSP